MMSFDVKWIWSIAAAIVAEILIVLYIVWATRKTKPDEPIAHEHEWRSIAAPYVRQCRGCGSVEFHQDGKGDFPDGLREYMLAMQHGGNGRKPNLFPPIRQDLCYCGASMVKRDDDPDLGPI
jgi:hypothetical protein